MNRPGYHVPYLQVNTHHISLTHHLPTHHISLTYQLLHQVSDLEQMSCNPSIPWNVCNLLCNQFVSNTITKNQCWSMPLTLSLSTNKKKTTNLWQMATSEIQEIHQPCPHWKGRHYKQEADQFTRATIHGNIDDIVKSKQSIHLVQVAQVSDGSQVKCILVEGAARVGKSTFAWKLCRKWGIGKLLQQYQSFWGFETKVYDLQRPSQTSSNTTTTRSRKQQLKKYKNQEAVGCSYYLKDMMNSQKKYAVRNWFFWMSSQGGSYHRRHAVLITSRPWASEFLHRECKEHISQHIKILGFTKDNIQSYLETAITSDPSLLALI